MKLIPYHQEDIYHDVLKEDLDSRYIQADQLWEASASGKGSIVAVIDTGAEQAHPWLKDHIIGGKNFTREDQEDPTNITDYNGHGTHVAGIVRNVAPKSDLLILKALDTQGNGTYHQVTEAIRYAKTWRKEEQQVHVICLSLGAPQPDEALHQSIQEAVAAGISVVVAAGNDGDGREETNEYSYPGRYNEVIQVGAINYENELAFFSNINEEIDLVAPGVDIISSHKDRQYAKMSGTSMAAPHVAGALALLINVGKQEFQRSLTEPELYAQLIKRTVPLGYEKSGEGNGLLQLNIEQYLNGYFDHVQPSLSVNKKLENKK